MASRKKVLIATMYEAEPVFRAITHQGVNKLVLIVDDKMDETQEKSYKTILGTLGRVLNIQTVEVSKLDVVDISTKVVDAIDKQDIDDVILVDITSGIKTVAIGTLYASFVRSSRVTSITYNADPQHGERVVTLPKITFRLSEGQRKVLDFLQESIKNPNTVSFALMADKIGASRAMLYRNIDELKKRGLVADDGGLHLTDAGRIATL